MLVGVKPEGATRLVNAPPRKRARRPIYIFIMVADRPAFGVLGHGCQVADYTQVVHCPHRVQLKQLTRKILIGAAAGIGDIVQVIEHGRAGGDGLQHGAEVAQQVAANHIAVIVNPDRGAPVVKAINVEMVVPEVSQHFDKLPLAVEGAHKGGSVGLIGGADALRPFNALLAQVILPELRQRLGECRQIERSQPRVTTAVIQRKGVQLLLHVGPNPRLARRPQCQQRIQVARAGAKPHAVQGNDLWAGR